MSDIRFEGWLHRSGTGGVYQDSAGNVGIASTQPKTRLDIGNGGFQVGPTGIATVTTVNTTNVINSSPLSNRNIVINGAMEVDQRMVDLRLHLLLVVVLILQQIEIIFTIMAQVN